MQNKTKNEKCGKITYGNNEVQLHKESKVNKSIVLNKLRNNEVVSDIT